MNTTIDLQTFAEIGAAVSHFQSLSAWLLQLSPHDHQYTKNLKDYWERRISLKNVGWLERAQVEQWRAVDFHVVLQNWNSTSGGWGGIGGAAMTDSYTVIIENSHHIAGVYYNAKLAYLVEIDEEYLIHKARGFKHMPAMDDSSKLKILWKNDKKR